MGNASRVFAIAQAIRRQAPGVEVHFFSWGRGHDFLERAIRDAGGGNFQLHPLVAYPWLGRSSSVLPHWARMTGRYAWVYARNTARLFRARRRLRPETVVLDSDYHFLPFLFRRGRLFFVGQALDVVTRARGMGYRPRRWTARLSFWICEVADGMLQRALADKVFIPSFLESEDAAHGGRAVRIPLIVREEFRAAGRRQPTLKSVAVSSGSGIEFGRLSAIAAFVGGEVAATAGLESVCITCPDDFQEAEVVVVQGGLSSISECIALRKPMLVVPIRGRAEQEVNARTVERLGLGVSLENQDWKAALGLFGEGAGGPGAGATVLVHGAEVIARHLISNA
jgi:hypothetical protein